ncbi:MAG: hypothetical protein WCJ71_02385, partial [Candidatus Omnitrophota bacterium]
TGGRLQSEYQAAFERISHCAGSMKTRYLIALLVPARQRFVAGHALPDRDKISQGHRGIFSLQPI